MLKLSKNNENVYVALHLIYYFVISVNQKLEIYCLFVIIHYLK